MLKPCRILSLLGLLGTPFSVSSVVTLLLLALFLSQLIGGFAFATTMASSSSASLRRTRSRHFTRRRRWCIRKRSTLQGLGMPHSCSGPTCSGP